MFESKLYKKYFPINEKNTRFSEDEKKVLCGWVRSFKKEVRVRELDKSLSGYGYFTSYDLSKYDQKKMINMINQNCLDNLYLVFLNLILYRHKYNEFISFWFFPVMTKGKAESIFGEVSCCGKENKEVTSFLKEKIEGKNIFALCKYRDYKELVEKPTILHASESFVITDFSDELIGECRDVLEKNGYKIKVLNLAYHENMKNSFCYNPFYYVRKDEDVITLVDLLMRETNMSNTYQSEWDEVEAALLKSLCFYVKKELTEDKQNFSSVLKLLVCAYENDGKALDVIMDDLKARKPSHIALEYYNMFKTNSGKRRQGIVISCSIRLTPFNIPTIKNLTETDTIALDSIEKEKTVLVCIVSPADTSFYFLFAMLFSQLFEILSLPKNIEDNARKEIIPVRFFINDFSTINFYKMLEKSKPDNLAWTIYCHHVAVLKNMYPDSCPEILKNTDIFLFEDEYEKEWLGDFFVELREKEQVVIH